MFRKVILSIAAIAGLLNAQSNGTAKINMAFNDDSSHVSITLEGSELQDYYTIDYVLQFDPAAVDLSSGTIRAMLNNLSISSLIDSDMNTITVSITVTDTIRTDDQLTLALLNFSLNSKENILEVIQLSSVSGHKDDSGPVELDNGGTAIRISTSPKNSDFAHVHSYNNRIVFFWKHAVTTELILFDIKGRLIQRVRYPANVSSAIINTQAFSSGSYCVRIRQAGIENVFYFTTK